MEKLSESVAMESILELLDMEASVLEKLLVLGLNGKWNFRSW